MDVRGRRIYDDGGYLCDRYGHADGRRCAAGGFSRRDLYGRAGHRGRADDQLHGVFQRGHRVERVRILLRPDGKQREQLVCRREGVHRYPSSRHSRSVRERYDRHDGPRHPQYECPHPHRHLQRRHADGKVLVHRRMGYGGGAVLRRSRVGRGLLCDGILRFAGRVRGRARSVQGILRRPRFLTGERLRIRLLQRHRYRHTTGESGV